MQINFSVSKILYIFAYQLKMTIVLKFPYLSRKELFYSKCYKYMFFNI